MRSRLKTKLHVDQAEHRGPYNLTQTPFVSTLMPGLFTNELHPSAQYLSYAFWGVVDFHTIMFMY